MKKPKVNIDNEKLQLSSEILRAIAHPLRLQILEFIDQNKKINVNKIYNTLKLEQSITSQHLRILRDTEILETKRTGKYIFYSLNYARIENTVRSVNNFLERTKKNKTVTSE
jgi:ArsR family transcriptional regulator